MHLPAIGHTFKAIYQKTLHKIKWMIKGKKIDKI